MSKSKFFLVPESLSAQVTGGTFERGLAVYRNQLVLDYNLNALNSQEWSIDGSVQGSGREVHDVAVVVEASPAGQITFFSGRCSCPVASNCKHSVALTIKAAYKSGGFRAHADPANPDANLSKDARLSHEELQALKAAQQKLQLEARAAREAMQAAHKVSQWLDLFGADASQLPAQQVNAGEIDEHLIYTLSTGVSGAQKVLKLGSGLTRRLANGNWAKIKAQRYLNPRKPEHARHRHHSAD